MLSVFKLTRISGNSKKVGGASTLTISSVSSFSLFASSLLPKGPIPRKIKTATIIIIRINGAPIKINNFLRLLFFLGEDSSPSFFFKMAEETENSEEVIVHSSGDKVVSVGDFVGIDFSPQDCHIFDEKGGVFEKI